MKHSSFITLVMLSTALAWELDIRCPGYYDPPRRLHEAEDMVGSHEKELNNANAMQSVDSNLASHVTRNIRGSEHKSRRDLQLSSQIKLYWQEGYCWQEEWNERHWCLSCQGSKCGIGEPIVIQFCDVNDPTQQFSFIPIADTLGGQLKVAGENLCLERVSNDVFELATCGNSDRQILIGFKTDGSPFELNPSGKSDMCLANFWHHPKADERIYGSPCKSSRINFTGKFQTYSGTSPSNHATANDKTTLRSRKSKCTNCDACEGDCDDDGQCSGDLKCFIRTDGKSEVIPGCFGPGTTAKGYCYHAPYTGDKDSLRLRSKECSDSNQCDACEGDCDSDEQCLGDLKCFMRKSKEEVPGCTGSGTSAKDYCYSLTATVTSIESGKIASGNNIQVGHVVQVSSPVISSVQVTPLTSTITSLDNIFGRLRGSGCSKSQPCTACEGDCDNDDECEGNLICFQKAGPGDVPGCSGYDTSNTDFCVPAS